MLNLQDSPAASRSLKTVASRRAAKALGIPAELMPPGGGWMDPGAEAAPPAAAAAAAMCAAMETGESGECGGNPLIGCGEAKDDDPELIPAADCGVPGP